MALADWQQVLAECDTIEQAACGKIEKVYSKALKTAVSDYADFFDKVDKVMKGQIQPPQYYIDQGFEAVIKWQKGYIQQLMVKSSLIDGIAKDLEEAGAIVPQTIKDAMSNIYGKVYDNAVGNLSAEGQNLGVDMSFSTYNKRQIDAMQTASEGFFSKIAYAPFENDIALRRQLRNEMSQSLILGEGRREMIERIRSVTGYNVKRAQRIAQTERTRVQSQACWIAGEEAESEGVGIYNTWSCAMMPTSRQAHKDANQQKRRQGVPFDVGGEAMRYPGDPNGKACNVINCYCTIIPHVLMPGKMITDDGNIVDDPNYGKVNVKPDGDYSVDADGNIIDNTSGAVIGKSIFAQDAAGNITNTKTGEVVAVTKEGQKLQEYNAKKSDYDIAVAKKNALNEEIKKLKKEYIEDIWASGKVKITELGEKISSGSVDGKIQYLQSKIDDAKANGHLYMAQKYQSLLDGLNAIVDDYYKLVGLQIDYDIANDEVKKLKKELKAYGIDDPSLFASTATKKVKGAGTTNNSPLQPLVDWFTEEQKKKANFFDGYDGAKKADAFFRAKCGEVWQGATKSQRKAAYEYTVGSGKFNRPLSGYEGSWSQYAYKGYGNADLNYEGAATMIRNLTKMIQQSTYDEPVYLVRGCGGEAFDSYFGLKQGTFTSMSQSELDALVGVEFKCGSFMSCGSAAGNGFHNEISMKIYCPPGTQMLYCEPFSHYGRGDGQSWDGKSSQWSFGSEDETLLQRGGTYTISSVKKKGYHSIEVEIEVHPELGYDLFGQTATRKK